MDSKPWSYVYLRTGNSLKESSGNPNTKYARLTFQHIGTSMEAGPRSWSAEGDHVQGHTSAHELAVVRKYCRTKGEGVVSSGKLRVLKVANTTCRMIGTRTSEKQAGWVLSAASWRFLRLVLPAKAPPNPSSDVLNLTSLIFRSSQSLIHSGMSPKQQTRIPV